MKRQTLEGIIRFLMRVLTHTEYYGLENIPKEGGVLLATNHLSQLDSIALLLNGVRPDITALVADKYQKQFIINYLVKTIGAVYIDRSKADFGAFRVAAEVLNKGVALGIAPEGTRSTTATLLEGKQGTALLAMRCGVPVVPVAISGTEHGVQRTLTFQHPHIVATFGKPLKMPAAGRDNRQELLQQFTEEMMCQIAAMLPSRYWGFYQDHPRLKEILDGKTDSIFSA